MMLLPIVERELRVASRHWRTYWGRATVGAAALVAVMYMTWMAGQFRGPSAGALLLKIVSYLALCFCVFAGVTRTADCLSSEKREDTLGLLFLTHLRAHDIVFGKLAAASLHSVLFLGSTLPILAISVMLGGVSGGELLRIPLSLFNALLLSLSVGILASTLTKAQRKAMLAASLTILLLTVILPAVGFLINLKFNVPLVRVAMSVMSPIFTHEMSLTGGFGLSRNLFWISLGVQFTISICAIVASCLILPRAWQVKSGDGLGWKERIRLWKLGSPDQRRKRRTRFLERNPIFWLGARDRFGPMWPVLYMTGVLSVAAGCIIYYEIPLQPAIVIMFLSLGITEFYFRTRVATLSATLFANERQMGTWEMILSTPMTVREILKGNLMAVRHHLLRTYIFLLIVFSLAVWGAMEKTGAQGANGWFALMFGLFSIGEFYVLGYAGMWSGMRSRSAIHAPGQALLRITVMPWCTWLLILPVIFEVNALREAFERSGPYGFLVMSSIIWLVSTGLGFRKARRNLLKHFRDPGEAPSFFKVVIRKLVDVRRPKPSGGLPLLQPVARN
jgi:ABC-type transport system involved in multi-copper enzyme maturation permease subunit